VNIEITSKTISYYNKKGSVFMHFRGKLRIKKPFLLQAFRTPLTINN
jgi:hypothetical protein